jgi:hypothetical protein
MELIAARFFEGVLYSSPSRGCLVREIEADLRATQFELAPVGGVARSQSLLAPRSASQASCCLWRHTEAVHVGCGSYHVCVFSALNVS